MVITDTQEQIYEWGMYVAGRMSELHSSNRAASGRLLSRVRHQCLPTCLSDV